MSPSDDDVLSALRSARPDPEYRPSAHSPEARAMLAGILGHPEPARDRRRVARRRLVLAGIPALAAAGVAAVAVAAGVALPAGHPAGHPASEPGARLAAWTVTRQADGTIQVTFRQATDPAGLQRTLRADGVPASVTFTGHQNPACRSIQNPPPPNPSFGGPRQPFQGPLTRVMGGGGFSHQAQVALVIHPAELPSGEGVQIWTSGTPGAADNFQLHVNLVQATPQCTGS